MSIANGIGRLAWRPVQDKVQRGPVNKLGTRRIRIRIKRTIRIQPVRR